MFSGSNSGFSSSNVPGGAECRPSQYEPLMAKSTRPRARGGDQFVDRGVDCRVFAADAGAGEEAHHEEVPGRKGERGRDSGREVDRQGEHEQLLATEAVGQLAEEQRAQAGARDVDGCGHTDLGGADR